MPINGQLAGAFFACGLVIAILYGGAASWPTSIAKLVFLNIIAVVIEVLLHAVGNGISTESTPSFRAAPFYGVAQLLIALFFFFRSRKSRSEPRGSRIEPRFA